jgi:hypothetical protein
MDENQLAVYYESLRCGARDAREAAQTLRESVTRHVAPCAAAGDHHPDYQLTDVLNECASSTAARVNGHADHTDGIGQKFHWSGANYLNAEQISEEEIGALWSPSRSAKDV